MFMKNKNIIFILLALLAAMTSCSDEPKPPSRTILVYMAANNSLGVLGYDSKDIVEMRRAAQNGAIDDAHRLLIFHAPASGSQTLCEMTSTGAIDTLRIYDGSQYAVSADFMLQVFNDAKAVAPADDYGLILWSHALGWTQNGLDDDGPAITPKSWGEDRGRTMNITTLRRVLEASPWSWIYFDCCFMGSVEVAYELYPVLDTMVASATEVPLDGMPYDLNLPLLFMPEPDLLGAAENTFRYYDDLSGTARTVTISLIDLTAMPALADATRAIYEPSEQVAVTDFANLPLETGATPRFYDFGVYVQGLCRVNSETVAPELYTAWSEAHDDVVLYHRATPMLWNAINLQDFTGLSTFLPKNEADRNRYRYESLSWYAEVARYLYDKPESSEN